jgi:hypothetical protein
VFFAAYEQAIEFLIGFETHALISAYRAHHSADKQDLSKRQHVMALLSSFRDKSNLNEKDEWVLGAKSML